MAKQNKKVNSESLCVFSFDLSPETDRVSGEVRLSYDKLSVVIDGKETKAFSVSQIHGLEFLAGVGSVSVILHKKDESSELLCLASAHHTAEISAAVKKINKILSGACDEVYTKKQEVPSDKKGKFENLKRLFDLTAGYKRYVAVSVLFFLLVTAVSIVTPTVNRIIVDSYIKAQNPSVSAGFVFTVLSLALLALLQRGFSVLRGKSLIIAGSKMIMRLREMVFSKVSRLSVARISERTVGQLMKNVTGDTNEIQNFIVNDLSGLLEQLLTIGVVAVIMLLYDWRLALLVIIPAPLVCLSFFFFMRFMRSMFRIRWHLNASAGETLHDIFSGIRIVKAYGNERREFGRYERIVSLERDAQIKQEKVWAVIMPMLQFFLGFGEFVVLYFVGNKILSGEMTLGQMAQFSAYASMIYAPLRMLARMPARFASFSESVSKVFELIDAPEQITEQENAKDIKIKGNITFQNVSFGYDDSAEVLRNINLEIKSGEFIGLVGRSGVGKSTLINLIMRLYDAEEGRVLLDGEDIRSLSKNSLKESIGVVLQETFLFAGTVYKNIAFAKPEASRDEIISAAKAAGAHDFIIKLPDGYNTYIGEKGHTLSGGERQRIAIARALLKNPSILILDEATSALDTETEKAVQDAIEVLSRKRTTVAIAHRLSTLRNATRIVVLDKGRVAETGTHDELMEKGGIYHSLVLAQREMTKLPPPSPHFTAPHGAHPRGAPPFM